MGHNRIQAVPVASNKGFDSASVGRKPPSKKPKLTRYLTNEEDARTKSSSSDGWFEVPDVDTELSFLSKPLKAVILDTGKAIIVYKIADKFYCSDANGTAYQYPLADAKLLKLKTGPAVESPLDGSTYDLATGNVLAWCPKTNLVRQFLGALKDRANPIPLKVYPVEERGNGKLFVNLSI